MSAYALPGLPGLFPPLAGASCTFSVSVVEADPLHSEEKIEYEIFPQKQLSVPSSSVIVKDARLDTAGFIQSLTSSKNGTKRRRAVIRRKTCVPAPSSFSSQQEGSLLFDLSVCKSGRQYTVVRSLARIRKLKSDLGRELNCCLPELPSLPDDCKCLGFGLIQDVLRSYCPNLQEWFLRILDNFPCVHDSLSLTDFLYEPSEQASRNLPCLETRWRHRSLPGKLDAIVESEDEDSDIDCSSL